MSRRQMPRIQLTETPKLLTATGRLQLTAERLQRLRTRMGQKRERQLMAEMLNRG
ncbi:MAG: hypothetical protein IKF10_08245 [Lachnospiraceae bacterium]|nr:hypothetical protein [Lachnospiraceae bacterium]